MRWFRTTQLIACTLALACSKTSDGERTTAPRPSGASSAAGASPKPSASLASPRAALPPPPEPATVHYPHDAVHSPLPPDIVSGLEAIAKRGPHLSERRFAKVGDSITVSGDFLQCLSRKRGRDVQLASSNAHLKQTLGFFRSGRHSADPFSRESRAARIGMSAWQALEGSPSPLDRELREARGRYALVMYGTNDIEIGKLHHFADKLDELVRAVKRRGVIPILYTIPPRRDRKDAGADAVRYNAVIRATAQAHGVPLVDYFRALTELPGAGLGKDGIHPTTFHGKSGRNACELRPRGLKHGYNLRNLLTLEALDRVRRARTGALKSADAGKLLGPPKGRGTPDEPLVIEQLPFVGYARGAESKRAEWGCGRSAKGAETSFQLKLDEKTSIEAWGFDPEGVRSDLYLLGADGKCLESGRRGSSVTLKPGTYTLVVDRVREPAGRGEPVRVVVMPAP